MRTTAINLYRSRWRKLRNFSRVKERLASPQDVPGLDDRVDIARELGLPEGTVKSRLSRGRDALAHTLSEEVDHV